MPTITDFSRVNIQYFDDNGVQHDIPQRKQVALNCGNTIAPATGKPGRPAKWKLRHVLLFDTATGKQSKKVVIGRTTNPIWTGATTTVTIDGDTWKVESKIGEKRIVQNR